MIENLEALKGRIVISEVIGSYIPLRREGANLKGVCPFHADSTPSLVVSDSKGIYHCFACGAGGDALKFVQEYKKVDFVEAAREVAERIGFTLVMSGKDQAPKKDFFLLEYAKNCYKANRGEALGFYRARGISEEMIERFDLGYGVKLAEVSEEQSREFGFKNFLGRAIFPIKSHTGRVLGFGGRSLEKNPRVKYINSPTSQNFNKSAVLYGFDIAKSAIIKIKSVVICEGYIDVIMAHQAGIRNAVGTLGVALTKEHLAQIARFGAKVILCFDRDKAGREATLKASELLIKNRFFDSEVMNIDSSRKDIAEIVQHGESEALLEAQRIPIVAYGLHALLGDFATLSIEAKAKKIERLRLFFKELDDPFIREEYKKWVAKKYGIDANALAPEHQKRLNIPRYDPLEAQLLKLMRENERVIDYVLEYFKAEDFRTIQEPLKALLEGRECRELREVLLLETPNVGAEEAIRVLYKKKLERLLERVGASRLSEAKKLEKIIKIRESLKRMKGARA